MTKGKSKKLKGYRVVVDNKMKWLGDTDTANKVIRINKKLHKKKSKIYKKEKLIDTIYHETVHAKRPRMHEKTVRKFVKKNIAKLGNVKKSKLYGSIASV